MDTRRLSTRCSSCSDAARVPTTRRPSTCSSTRSSARTCWPTAAPGRPRAPGRGARARRRHPGARLDPDTHAAAGATVVGEVFGDRVGRLVGHHDAAKRYLVTVEPQYRRLLSERSVATLPSREGSWTTTSGGAFEATPDLDDLLDAAPGRRRGQAARVSTSAPSIAGTTARCGRGSAPRSERRPIGSGRQDLGQAGDAEQQVRVRRRRQLVGVGGTAEDRPRPPTRPLAYRR